MRIPSLLRTATLIVSLIAATTVVTAAAFADPSNAPTEQQQQGVNFSSPFPEGEFPIN